MNIRVDLNYPIKDGTEVVFRSPVDCSQVTGLKVYYDGGAGSQEFAFADAHGNNVGDIDHLFAENVVVKVILDVTTGMAFVQNADTNAYIERTFIKTVNGVAPDNNGNVVVQGGGGSGEAGADGFSPIAKVTQTDTGAVVTITDKSGTTTATIGNGKDGADGKTPVKGVDYTDGKDGANGTSVTVKSVSESTADGGSNVVTFSDDKTLTVKNGKKGADGKTPVKGVDYFTEADKVEMVTAVMEAIGCPVFGLVDENNNIVLSGALPDGTYSVKYEMENGSTINIGNMVLDTNVYYSVTNTLTNCTTNNSATQAVEGESYSATISANSGYELKSVTATMGGSAVSVSGGVINIASVTGDIVITAVAEEAVVEPSYTNVLPLSVKADDTPYIGDNGEDGYNTNKKISTSSGNESAATACVSGFITLPEGEQSIIRIKNITLSSAASINNFVFYDASKTRISGYYAGAGSAGAFHSDITVNDGIYLFSTMKWFPNDKMPVYFRFSCLEITDETIVTIDEDIV